jgi:hypothetical protein
VSEKVGIWMSYDHRIERPNDVSSSKKALFQP